MTLSSFIKKQTIKSLSKFLLIMIGSYLFYLGLTFSSSSLTIGNLSFELMDMITKQPVTNLRSSDMSAQSGQSRWIMNDTPNKQKDYIIETELTNLRLKVNNGYTPNSSIELNSEISIFLSQNCDRPGLFYHFLMTNPEIMRYKINVITSNSDVTGCIYMPDLFTYYMLEIDPLRDNHLCGSYESFIYSLSYCPTRYIWFLEPDVVFFKLDDLIMSINQMVQTGCWVTGPKLYYTHKVHPSFLDGKSVYLVEKILPLIVNLYPEPENCSAFDLLLFFHYHVEGIQLFHYDKMTKAQKAKLYKKRKLRDPEGHGELTNENYCSIKCYINVRDYGKILKKDELNRLCAIA